MLQSFQAVRVAAWLPVVGLIYYIHYILSLLFSYPLEFFPPVAEICRLIWSEYDYLFLTVLFLRYFRLVVNTFALYFLSQPDEIPEYPTITSNMAHVIIPSVEPTNEDFKRCVESVLAKQPGWITVVTANQAQSADAQAILDELDPQNHTQLAVTTGPMANKRHQLAHVLRRLAVNREQNKDVLVVFVDDHVWWPSARFLEAVLAPFENPKTGIVAMHKQPERNRGNSFADSLLNFIACLYLERHNFEIGASNAIDGSAFVVSGRTSVIRASIAMEDEFINGFVNERFFFGLCGPLNPDDDNYITRYIVRKGWNIKWQNQPEALMVTSLGVTGGYKKFSGQIDRWARSQWRSNPCSVFTDRSIWTRGYLWGGFFFLVSFFNFALVWDPLIVCLWYRSGYDSFNVWILAVIILGSKFIKVAPFFFRNPQDWWLFPFQVLFAYYHSYVKLKALFTFYDHSWSGRNLAAIDAQAAHDDDENDDDDRQHGRGRSGSRSPSRYYTPVPASRSPSRYDTPEPAPRSQRRSPAHSSTSQSSASRSPGSDTHFDSDDGYDSDAATYVRDQFPSFTPKSVSTHVSTPWGRANLSNRHLTPANVREGQYVQNNPANFHGTPRTSASPPRAWAQDNKIAVSAGAVSTGYLAHNELSGGVWPFREIMAGAQPSRSNSAGTIRATSPRTYTMPQRTHFTAPVPDAPGRKSIVFIKDSPFPALPSPTERVMLRRPATTNSKKLTFTRDYPRGDDCLKIHPDGTYLTARRPSSGMRRCRSPEPSFEMS